MKIFGHVLLLRSKDRLDTLNLYPEPVKIDNVKIHVLPWLFEHVFPFTEFDGYALRRRILFRSLEMMLDEDLLTHELCHIWQQQHHPIWMPLSYWVKGYEGNRFELEAEEAVAATCTFHP
jgi:hypothetical protein